MSDAVLVKVRVSNDEQNYTKKFLSYESITVSREDPELVRMVREALADLKGVPEDVNVTLNMVW